MIKEYVYRLSISRAEPPFEYRALTVRFYVSVDDVAGVEIGKAVQHLHSVDLYDALILDSSVF